MKTPSTLEKHHAAIGATPKCRICSSTVLYKQRQKNCSECKAARKRRKDVIKWMQARGVMV